MVVLRYAHRFFNISPLVFVVWLLNCVQLFCDPMDGSLQGSSAHEISQARTLEWIAISFAQGSNPHLLLRQMASLPLTPLGSLTSPFKRWFNSLHPERGQ